MTGSQQECLGLTFGSDELCDLVVGQAIETLQQVINLSTKGSAT